MMSIFVVILASMTVRGRPVRCYVVHTANVTPGPAMSATMTLRLDEDLKRRLDRLAKVTQRTRSFLAAEAIREFVDFSEWQIGEIEEALAEADREEFAGDHEVGRVLGKWGVSGG